MTEKRLIHEGDDGVAHRVVLTDIDGNPVNPSNGGVGGGGAVTIADGADVAQGATSAAAAAADGTGNYSLVAAAKRALLNWATLLARTTTLGQKASSGSMPVVLASDQSRVNVEPLGIPGTARQQATTTTSANVELTAGVGRVSLCARGQPLRYVVGSSAQTANAATSHYLGAGDRVDIGLPATPNIAVIRASDATADGAAEFTEIT